MATGPLTKDTTTIALGLAQIRIGASAANMDNPHQALSSSDSIGALANTKFVSTAEYYKLDSGFPLLEDETFPLRENASLECSFKELTPFNMALAKGIDPTSGYSDAHSGEVPLGDMTSPDMLRMEALYTFPDGTNKMHVEFPRSQVVSAIEVDLQAEEPAVVPITNES